MQARGIAIVPVLGGSTASSSVAEQLGQSASGSVPVTVSQMPIPLTVAERAKAAAVLMGTNILVLVELLFAIHSYRLIGVIASDDKKIAHSRLMHTTMYTVHEVRSVTDCSMGLQWHLMCDESGVWEHSVECAVMMECVCRAWQAGRAEKAWHLAR